MTSDVPTRRWNRAAIASLVTTLALVVVFEYSLYGTDRIVFVATSSGGRAAGGRAHAVTLSHGYLGFEQVDSWRTVPPDSTLFLEYRARRGWSLDHFDVSGVTMPGQGRTVELGVFRYRRNGLQVLAATGGWTSGISWPTSGISWQTWEVPLWAAAAVASWPFLRRCAWQWRGHRRAARGVCPTCAYDLGATPGRCPECGRGAADATRADVTPFAPGR